MSRYFELMQESERDEASKGGRRGGPVPLSSANHPLDSDLPFLGANPSLGMVPQPRLLQPHAPHVLSWRSLAEACFRRPLRFACIAGGTMLVTILAILFMPRRYQATMQLVVLNARQYAAIRGDSSEPATAAVETTETDVNSQAQLLRSRDVLSQAVDQVGVSASTATARDEAIDALARTLQVAPVRSSNILNVSYTASSPEKAKAVLQAVASSFVSRELTLLRPQHQQSFAELMAQDQRELSAAQQEFARFKLATGMGSSAEYQAAVLRQLDGYTAQSANLKVKTPEQRRRSASSHQTVEELTAKLVDLENKRTTLLTGYQPTELQQVDLQITRVENQLSRLQMSNAVATASDVAPSSLDGKSPLVDARKRVYLSQLNQLEAQSAEFDRLQNRVNDVQRSLDLAAKKRDQTVVDDSVDKDRILDVAFIAKPSASSVPVQPRPGLYLTLGLLTAMVLGIGFCALGESTRSTIFSPAELDALTGFPTLASVPLERLEDGKQAKGRR